MEKSYEMLCGIERHLERLCSSVDKLFLLLQNNQAQEDSRRVATIVFNEPSPEQMPESIKALRNIANKNPDNGISKNNK